MATGRPPFEITDAVIQEAEKLAGRGLTMEQIAHCLGISVRTLHEKKVEFPHLAQAIKKGRAEAIYQVSNALYERGLKGSDTAAIFWLKTVAGWSDKGNQDNLDNLDDEPVKEVPTTYEEAMDRIKKAAQERRSA